MDKKIVVIGGGTGSFMLLSALKHHTRSLTAIVGMADDGGSTGVLRDELGVLPPGDVRQCLVALSESPKVRELFNYRFDEGTFDGHSFGNILLTALEKVTGSFAEAIETASEILRVDGRVVPSTLDNVRLEMSWDDERITLLGEHTVDAHVFRHDPRKAELRLIPAASANPAAVAAIMDADMVVIAPGDLYTSLAPSLVIPEIGEAICTTSASIAYVCNLVTRDGQTDGFTVESHASEVERFIGAACLDYVLYNQQQPPMELLRRYKEEGANIVSRHGETDGHYRMIAGNFLGEMRSTDAGDKLAKLRSFIRHDGTSIARMLFDLVTLNNQQETNGS